MIQVNEAAAACGCCARWTQPWPLAQGSIRPSAKPAVGKSGDGSGTSDGSSTDIGLHRFLSPPR
ncbi:hypothetical protein D5047_04310 [Verminephrobacter eiseniae]|nr:hypothetical protein [Verminephrobacter eiseniae]